MPRRTYRSRSRTAGHRAALQHIEEARQLSQELGGTDQDVKNYFFGLPASELRPILDEYERQYGRSPREYAEETLPSWKSGRVQMSGLVASRLFALLPARMRLTAKYRLTEDLWNHVGPSSRKMIRVGAGATLDDVVSAADAHISGVVVGYTIPYQLERRFEWLTSGDVQLKQQLLNRLLDAEKELVIDGVRAQFPVMRSHADGQGGEYTTRLAQIVTIGKHELELVFDQTAVGVTLEDPSPRWAAAGSSGENWNWVWWLIAGGGLLAVLAALSER